jgi:hypothetical protein
VSAAVVVKKRDGGTYLPAGWWVHHHPGRFLHQNGEDVIVVGRLSPLSIVGEVSVIVVRIASSSSELVLKGTRNTVPVAGLRRFSSQ